MNLKTIAIFIAVTLGLLVGVGAMLTQFGNNIDKPIPEIAGESKNIKGIGEITLVEFSDFQCPACLSIQEPLKLILSKYEGKVKLVYRHFPLTTIHKNAQNASFAAEAAAAQGKFWEMHDKLFATQSNWKDLPNSSQTFTDYAKDLGLDENQFKIDLDSQSAKDRVSVDVLAATRYSISSTPTFYVNGIKTEFGNLEAKIDSFAK